VLQTNLVEISGIAVIDMRNLQAMNGAGLGPYSAVSWCQTPMSSPGPVMSVRVSSVTATTIHLHWKEPVSNGSRIQSYNIDVGDSRQLVAVDSGALDYVVRDLLPETTYKWV